MKKTNLNVELILSKKFSTELTGYNAAEVDKFLDEVINDYKVFINKTNILVTKLEEKNNIIETKEDKIQKFAIEIDNLKNQLKEASQASNYEVLKGMRDIKKELNSLKDQKKDI